MEEESKEQTGAQNDAFFSYEEVEVYQEQDLTMNTLNTTLFRDKYLGRLEQTLQTDDNNRQQKEEIEHDDNSDIQSKTSSENQSRSSSDSSSDSDDQNDLLVEIEA